MSAIGALIVLAIVSLGAMGVQASPVRTLECEVVVAGGGFAGVAASLEALSLNRKVCMTEIDATETGEMLPLAGVSYRLGTDRRTPWEPGASTQGNDPYCTQNFTCYARRPARESY